MKALESAAPWKSDKIRWLNSIVLGIGLASLFRDWSHEIATTAMPTFLATMGVAAAWVGLIEGVSDVVRTMTPSTARLTASLTTLFPTQDGLTSRLNFALVACRR